MRNFFNQNHFQYDTLNNQKKFGFFKGFILYYHTNIYL